MLSSPRLTLALLIALALAGLVGCIVPQGLEPQEYVARFGAALAGIIRLLSLAHVFTSWWFLCLVGLLLANVTACVGGSLRRARRRAATLGWVAYASPALHLSILLVAVGAVLGRLPGVSLKEELAVMEGDHSRVRNTEIIVTLKDFRMSFDETTGRVSAYTSEVAFEDDKGKAEATIEVNKPANFSGCQFQQASWGLAGVWLELSSPQGDRSLQPISLREAEEGEGESRWAPAAPGNHCVLPDTDAAIVATRYVPEGELVEASGGTEVRPVGDYPRRQFLYLKGVTGLRTGKQQVVDVGWVGERDEVKWEGWTLKLGEPVYYSVFGVRRDPGLPLVWLGFLLFTVSVLVILGAPGRGRERT